MKRLFLTLATLLVGIPAWGADMPVKAPAAAVAAPNAWSGLYFGINGAGAKTSAEFTTPLLAVPGSGNVTPTGAMAGITVGAGIWSGNTYLGVEADADYDFTKGNNTCLILMNCKVKSGFFLTQRLVVGATLPGLMNAAQTRGVTAPAQWPVPVNVPANFAASGLMPYLTGGVAERRTEACITDPLGIGLVAGCQQEWLIGWTGGGGIKIPVSSGITFDVSYLYVGWNKHFSPASRVAIFPTDFKASNEQVLKAGLQFHL